MKIKVTLEMDGQKALGDILEHVIFMTNQLGRKIEIRSVVTAETEEG